MTNGRIRSPGIERVRYTPPEPYQLDLEIFSIGERAKSVNPDSYRGTHRIDFHLLIYVTKGSFTHTVDFTPIRCEPGSVLALRPAQMQRFDMERKWDAWFVLFRPEFLLPIQSLAPLSDIQALGTLGGLPVHFSLEEIDRNTVHQAITQMHSDAKLNGPSADVHTLLRHQLYALLLRLRLIHKKKELQAAPSPTNLQRFNRFQQLLEKNFAIQHQVAKYAQLIGVSEKGLTRATLDVAGMTAKSYIASRVALEAKRLLAHTALPITVIADMVGFDESTNFVKFFRRHAGCSPGEFRRQHVK